MFDNIKTPFSFEIGSFLTISHKSKLFSVVLLGWFTKELHADHRNGLLTTRRRYGSGEGHSAVCVGASKRALPHGTRLCKIKCNIVLCPVLVAVKNAVAAGESKEFKAAGKQGCDCMAGTASAGLVSLVDRAYL